MTTRTLLAAGLSLLLGLASVPLGAEEKKDGDEGAADPELAGEEVEEQSEIEKLLCTEYRKRRSPHFFLETSRDKEACKAYVVFCERAYGEFLRWAGKPADFDLWNTRARVAILANKAEWECLMKARNKGRPPAELERLKHVGGQWSGRELLALHYSREGSTEKQDELQLFHSLNHLFLAGLQKSGGTGTVWWLYEGFSLLREVEVFGARAGGCIGFDTRPEAAEDRAWNDPDSWVSLLRRDVRMKQDEDFTLFWRKGLTAIQNKTYVKGWSILRWMCRDPENKARFVRFVEMLKADGDQPRALETAFGKNPDGIDAEWKKWIQRQKK